MKNYNQQQARHPRKRINVIWLSVMLIGLVLIGVFVARFVPRLLTPARVPPVSPTAKMPVVALTQEQCAEKLPVHVLVGQVLMVGLAGSQLSQQTDIFKKYHVGGAVIMSSPADPYDGSILAFKKNGGSREDPLLISTDEEGGFVQRFQDLGVLPAPATVAHAYNTAQAETMITRQGIKLKTIGIDMVLGPLADVAPLQGTSVLGSRVFSNNPSVVSDYVAAYVKGWQTAGLLPTLKHFPGLGSATDNTDFRPATTPPLSSLQQRDFLPYPPLASSGTAVMIGNQNVPGWFSGPASLSPEANAYLRDTLGYANNMVITDSLDAAAITSTMSVSAAVVKAITAGNDMAIIVAPDPSSMTQDLNLSLIEQSAAALERAVQDGTLPKHQLAVSVVRKLTAQHVLACSLTL